MFGPKVKLRPALFEKLKSAAAVVGCTPEELAEKGIEKEVDRVLAQTGKREASAAEVDEIANKLKGLGYLE